MRNSDKLSARELDAEIRRLTAVVRDGKASPAELGSCTFTLNNYGVFGVDGSAAIINHPEVGILGVGRIIDKPWVVNGELAVRKVTEPTLTFDHRVCAGGTAGGFLLYVTDAIENPARCWFTCPSCFDRRESAEMADHLSGLKSPQPHRRLVHGLPYLLGG